MVNSLFSILKFEDVTRTRWEECFEFYRQISQETYPYREFSEQNKFIENISVSDAFALGLKGFILCIDGKMSAACHYRFDASTRLLTSELKFLQMAFNSDTAQAVQDALISVCHSESALSIQMVVEDAKVLSHYLSTGKFSKVGECIESVLDLNTLNLELMNSWISTQSGFSARSIEWSDQEDLKAFVALFNETSEDMPFQEAQGLRKIRSIEYFVDRAANTAGRNRVWLPYALFENELMIGIILFEGRLHSPQCLYVEATGIHRKYRGRGLGKFLKASSALDLRRNIPSLKYILTGNEETNAPMLSINRAMGFAPSSRFTMLRCDSF